MNENPKPTLFHPGVGNGGMTELHYAAYCGDLPELERCLAAGMDVNVIDTYRGYTALHWLADMAATGGPRVEMLTVLANHGADINIKAADATSPLMLAKAAGSRLGDALASELIALGAFAQ